MVLPSTKSDRYGAPKRWRSTSSCRSGRRATAITGFSSAMTSRIRCWFRAACCPSARTASRMRSEEHTSELQSLMRISYAVFCLKKKKQTKQKTNKTHKSKYNHEVHEH